MTDLGAVHQPLTDLFPVPRTPAEWEPYVLKREQVDEFQARGFLQGIPILSAAQLTALRQQLDEVMRPGHAGSEHFYEYHQNESEEPGSVLFHALGAWRVRPAFHDILWSPAFRMAAYQLLGQPFRLFHDQLFCKPAGHGGRVAWHQDYSYWTWTQPMAHLTCWMALDDVDEGNGCLRYVPGSHRWGLLERRGLASDMDAVLEQLNGDQRQALASEVPVQLSAGYASFHHPLTLHGSFENHSPRRRRATLINVFADGVLSGQAPGAEPGTSRYPTVPQGEPMAGTGYPLLLDPEAEFGSFLGSIPTL